MIHELPYRSIISDRIHSNNGCDSFVTAVTALCSWGIDPIMGSILLSDSGHSRWDVELKFAATFWRINDNNNWDRIVLVFLLENLFGLKVGNFTPVACATSPVVI